jgi:hypothetical protein
MAKNESAAPARTGGKTSKPGAPTAGDQPQKDNLGANEWQPGSTSYQQSAPGRPGAGDQTQLDNQGANELQPGSTSYQQSAPGGPVAGDQGGQIEAGSTGASAASSIGSLIESIYGLEVTSSQAGFRRAGRAWSTTPTVIKLSDFTEVQLRQIAGEPMLTVKPVLFPAEEA